MKKFLSLVLALLLVAALLVGCVTPTPPDGTPDDGTPKDTSIRDYLKNVSKSLQEYDSIGIAPKGFSTAAEISNAPKFAYPMNEEDGTEIPDEENPFDEITDEDFDEEPATLYGRVGRYVEEILFKTDSGEEGSITDYGFEVIQLYQTDTFIAFAVSEYTEEEVGGRTVINRTNSITLAGDSVSFDNGVPFIADTVFGRVYETDLRNFSINGNLIISSELDPWGNVVYECRRVSFSETEMTETVINSRGGELRGVYDGVPVFYGSDLTASDTANRVEYVSDYYNMDYAAFDGDISVLYPVRWFYDYWNIATPWIIDIYYDGVWISIVEFLDKDISFYNKFFGFTSLGSVDDRSVALMGVCDGELLFVRDFTFGAIPGYAWDQTNSLIYSYSYIDIDAVVYVGEVEITLKQFVREHSFNHVDSGAIKYHVCYSWDTAAGVDYGSSLMVFMRQHPGLYKLETDLEGGKWYYLESIAGDNEPVWVLISDYVQENEVRTQLPIV
ncbi:MAG: hypothetical protein WC292_01585 [Clostridia bacterium]